MDFSRIILAGRTGIQLLGDGVEAAIRLGKEGQLIVGEGQGRHYEAARRRRLFFGMTAKTGVAPGTDIGTTAAFALVNLNESDVDLVVHKVSIGYVSGTLGAGYVAACLAASSQTAVSGTGITPVAADGGASSKARAYTTATLPAAPSQLFPLWNLGAALASSVAFPSMPAWDFEGGVIVKPGASLSLQAVAAAGSTPLVVFGALWEEVPRLAA